MIRRFYRWLAVVLPPSWILAACILVLLFMTGIELWIRWICSSTGVESPEMTKVRWMMVGAACCSYGVFRAIYFHPYFLSDYRTWLESTPWTIASPLPLGPLHLVWQDVVVLGIAWLCVFDSPYSLTIVVTTFFVMYLVVSALVLRLTGLVWLPYGVMYGLGLAALLSPCLGSWPSLGLLILLYLPIRLGLRTSLGRFPWPELANWGDITKHLKIQTQHVDAPSNALGWPFDRLQPRGVLFQISRTEKVLISFLVGWLALTLTTPVPDPEGRLGFLSMSYALYLPLCVISRLVIYCQYHWPPISLLGRIFTSRWIIPNYDRVLIAPFCAILVGGPGVGIMFLLGLPLELALTGAITLVMLITLLMGPSFEQWQLTGGFRLTPGLGNRADIIKL